MKQQKQSGRSPDTAQAKNSFHEHVLSTYHKNALNLSRSQKQSLTCQSSSKEQNTKNASAGNQI